MRLFTVSTPTPVSVAISASSSPPSWCSRNASRCAGGSVASAGLSRAPISRAPARTSGSSSRAPGIASSGSSSSSAPLVTSSTRPVRAPVIDQPVVRDPVEPRRELRGRLRSSRARGSRSSRRPGTARRRCPRCRTGARGSGRRRPCAAHRARRTPRRRRRRRPASGLRRRDRRVRRGERGRGHRPRVCEARERGATRGNAAARARGGFPATLAQERNGCGDGGQRFGGSGTKRGHAGNGFGVRATTGGGRMPIATRFSRRS